MAIKFIGKDQPKAAPVADKALQEKTDSKQPVAKDETSAGADLFSADAKRPVNRRKTK